MNSKEKTSIYPTPNGPYIVEHLEDLTNRNGAVETKPKMALCRCGGSNNKPFCDGTHATNGFSSEKLDGRVPDKLENFSGKGIVIHDNRGICAHAGRCTDGLPSVFRLRTEPWIDAQASSTEEISRIIDSCPSGALSYTIAGVKNQERDNSPKVFIARNGPYVVSGNPELVNTPRGEGASTEHFTLCRCGGSRNKPFCDGTHWHNRFTDDKN